MSLSKDYQYSCEASDFSVARFIKYSRKHTAKLNNVFAKLAVPYIYEEKSKKKWSYRFQPRQPVQKMNEDNFDQSCQTHLSKFLESYESKRKHFNQERLKKAYEKAPAFFYDQPSSSNQDLYVKWHIHNSLVLITGLKSKVNEKENEINQFLDESVPKYLPKDYQFNCKTKDIPVARFIKYSKKHTKKLNDAFASLAVASINEESKNKLEYRFQPIQVLKMTAEDFDKHCKKIVTKFLENYQSKKNSLHHECLKLAHEERPQFFCDQSGNDGDGDLFVKWHIHNHFVLIAGSKVKVNQKEAEIDQFLDEFMPKVSCEKPTLSYEKQKVKNTMRQISHCKSKTYKSPDLLLHFNSSTWKEFSSSLEQQFSCTVQCSTSKSQSSTSDGVEKIKLLPTTQHCSNYSNANEKNSCETFYGSIKVSVCCGDICQDNSDVIVNGVISDEFNLSRGSISSALLTTAGKKLQVECNSESVSSLKDSISYARRRPQVDCNSASVSSFIGPSVGSSIDQLTPIKTPQFIRFTRGFNLQCKHVIHVVTPNQCDELTTRLKAVFDLAEQLQAKSIALPTLGAGGVGLPAAEVASSIATALELFSEDQPCNVDKVKVVVYDLSMVGLFQSKIVQAKREKGLKDTELNDELLEAVQLSEAKLLSLQSDTVCIDIRYRNNSDLPQIEARVNEHMSDVIVTKTIEVEVDCLSELDDHDKCDIYEAAVSHKVLFNFDSMSSEIKLEGMNKNVRDLYFKVRELMVDLREAVCSSKKVVWKWAISSNSYFDFPLRVSGSLEKEYKKNSTRSCYVDMYGLYLSVDFPNMTFEFKFFEGKLKRLELESAKTEEIEKIPSYWSDMMGKPWLKISLDSNSSEYKRVVSLFQASNPQYNRIDDIERIQYPSLYKQYLIKKNDVQRHMRSKEPVERELFHGTSSADAEKICANNFDRGFSGKSVGAAYGKGCYFALKSDYAVKIATQGGLSIGCVFLAQVLTGDYCKGSFSLVSPPEKPYVGDTSRKYDSVVDNESSPSMFVVFNDTSVYPAYLISFR